MPNKIARIVVTGGDGQLAGALKALDPAIDAPPRSALDVARYESLEAYCAAHPPAILIHAAAVTNTLDRCADEDFIRTNIIGTANVVLWCLRHQARLVYLSTDYVYPGQRGDYSEESVLFPVNRYAKSKLGGEMAVQLYDRALIIRTSFYSTMAVPRGCTDQYTSRMPLAEAAKAVYELAARTDLCGIVNVGSRAKRSLYEIVKAECNPQVAPCTRWELPLPYLLPPDSSLNTAKCSRLMPPGGLASKAQTACRICGSTPLMEYLHLGMTPLANSYLTEDELAREEFKEELALRLCESCGLSQLSKVVHPDRMFRRYLYVSSTTETFRRHCRELAAAAVATAGARPGDWALDIASNDGCLLSHLRDLGMNVVGVDPAENLAREATAAGIPTLCAYWSRGLAQDIRSRFAPPRVITSTNVLAHVDDVHEFAAAVDEALAPRGVWVIECPSVVDFIERNEFDTAYHEHLSYLSVHALSALMAQHALEVFDVDALRDLHGGTIRAWVARPHDYPVTPRVEAFLARERAFGVTSRAPYEAFARRVRENRSVLLALLKRLRDAGKTVWAYGASAKGNTLLSYCDITRETIPAVVDDNQKKWGFYTPGAHVPIVGIDALAKARVDYLVLLAWNFQAEIMRRCQAAGYGGGFILPVPRAELIEGVPHPHSREGVCRP